jgi:hypothetical protein
MMDHDRNKRNGRRNLYIEIERENDSYEKHDGEEGENEKMWKREIEQV